MTNLLFLLAVFFAIRSLMSLILKRRDALHELLVAHVKETRAEQRKKLQILEFRRRKRRDREMQAAALAAAANANAKAESPPDAPAKAA